jgi:hypothetical protein
LAVSNKRLMTEIVLALMEGGCDRKPIGGGFELNYMNQTITTIRLHHGLDVSFKIHPDNLDKSKHSKQLHSADIRFEQAKSKATDRVFLCRKRTITKASR